jgi:hypothetical protein
MAEGLQTLDGQPVELAEAEREFHAAMAAPAQDEPAHAAPPKKDAEAPYGRKADGTPRKRAPGPGRPAHDKPRVASASSATGKTETLEEVAKRRKDGVAGLVQITAAGTLMMHQRTGEISWQADTITLTTYTEPLADAVEQTCAYSASFARLVDKVTGIGPFAALTSVGLGLAAQLASNHGIQFGRMLGAAAPQDVIAEFESANADSAS